MCGRSRQTVQPQALASAVGFNPNVPLRRANHYRRRENAHPGNATPIAYKTRKGDDALRAMRWGLVPSFTRKGEKPNFFRMFNARSETAAEKPSFRRLVGRRHGVVAFTGFYEWKQDDKGERQPYYFHFEDGRPLLFAVLYDTWQQGERYIGGGGGGSEDGTGNGKAPAEAMTVSSAASAATARGAGGGGESEAGEQKVTTPEEREQEALVLKEVEEEDSDGTVMFSYAVLTTSAAPRLRWLHERMPVILRGAEDAEWWLKSEGPQASTFLKNHIPYNVSDLVWHPVSKQMNTMRYDGDDCSAAITLKPTKPLPAITSFFKKKTSSLAAVGLGGGSADAAGRNAAGGSDAGDGVGGLKAPSPSACAGNAPAGVSPNKAEDTGERGHIAGGRVAAVAAGYRAAAPLLGLTLDDDDNDDDRGESGSTRASSSSPSAAMVPAAVATAVKSSASLLDSSPSTTAGAKRSRPENDDGREGVGEGVARKSPSSPATRRKPGTPSPRKGPSGSKKGGGGGGSPAARDKKQPRLTSFFQPK